MTTNTIATQPSAAPIETVRDAAQMLLDRYDEMRGDRIAAAEFEILRAALTQQAAPGAQVATDDVALELAARWKLRALKAEEALQQRQAPAGVAIKWPNGKVDLLYGEPKEGMRDHWEKSGATVHAVYIDDAQQAEAAPFKVGDIITSEYGHDLQVCIDDTGKLFGKLVCEAGHSCENIPYSLNGIFTIKVEAAPAPTAEPATPLDVILHEVEQERSAQDAQWGGPAHDDAHGNKEFAQFIYNQISRVGDGGYVGCDDRRTFIKVAALAVAAIEKIDRTSISSPAAHPATGEEK